MSCSSQTADTACPSSRTFLKIATLSAALCCRYRRARLLPMSPSSYVPDDYIPAGLGTPLSAEAGHEQLPPLSGQEVRCRRCPGDPPNRAGIVEGTPT